MEALPIIVGNDLGEILERQKSMILTLCCQHEEAIRCFQELDLDKCEERAILSGRSPSAGVSQCAPGNENKCGCYPVLSKLPGPRGRSLAHITASVSATSHPSNLTSPPPPPRGTPLMWELGIAASPRFESSDGTCSSSETQGKDGHSSPKQEKLVTFRSVESIRSDGSAGNREEPRTVRWGETTVDPIESEYLGSKKVWHWDKASVTSRESLRSTASTITELARRKRHSISVQKKLIQGGVGPTKFIYFGGRETWPPCILDPHSYTVVSWNVCIALSVLFVCFATPFSICFSWWTPGDGYKFVSTVLEIIFWCDVVISFRTAFSYHGHLVVSAKLIAIHYMRFWFWIDMLANIPWEFLLGKLFDQSSRERKTVKMLKWLKLPRLMRLATLRKIFNSLGGHGKYMKLCVGCFYLLFAMHLLGCAWVYSLSPCQDIGSGPDSLNNGDFATYADSKLGWTCRQGSIFSVYFQALHISASVLFGNHVASSGAIDNGYYSLLGYNVDIERELESIYRQSIAGDNNLLQAARAQRLKDMFPHALYTGGVTTFGDIPPDLLNRTAPSFPSYGRLNTWGLNYWNTMFILMILAQVIGLILIGNVIAQLIKIVLTSNWEETFFRMKTEAVCRELEQHGGVLTDDLQLQLHLYFRWRYLNTDFGPLQLLSKDIMTHSTRRSIAKMLYGSLLQKSLGIYDSGLIAVLCLAVQSQVYMRGQIIYQVGDHASGLYVVEIGRVTVSGFNDQDPVRDVLCGEAFGEFEFSNISGPDDSPECFGTKPTVYGAFSITIDGSLEVTDKCDPSSPLSHCNCATAVEVSRILLLDGSNLRDVIQAYPDFPTLITIDSHREMAGRGTRCATLESLQ